MKAKTKNTQYCLLAVLGILFTTFSCSDDFFNQQAGNRIDPEKHYQSFTDMNVSLNGALIPLQEVMPNVILTDGLRSDMLDVTSNADGNMRDILNESFSPNNPYLDPSGFYKVIIGANEILANIDRVPKADPNFDEFFLHYEKGALIGLRSWAYFNLVKLYGEAVWIKDNLPSYAAGQNQLYIPKLAMIDTLINQVTPYIHTDDKLAELYVGGYFNTKMLLGELYLEKNDYANAVTYLKLGCESYGNGAGFLKVDKTYTKDAWKSLFMGSGYGIEHTGYVIFASTEGQLNPLTGWMKYTEQFKVKPTQKVVDNFLAQVPVKGDPGDLYRGLGITFDTIPGGGYYVSKYSLDIGEPYSADIITSRAADIHLLLAEALNRMGDPTTALILLNAGMNGEKKKPTGYTKWASNFGVRGRAYLQAKTVPDEIVSDANATMLYVEDMIIEERALELAYEGKRFTDLVRVASRRNDPSYLANKVASKFSDPAMADNVRQKLMNEANWYFPVNK